MIKNAFSYNIFVRVKRDDNFFPEFNIIIILVLLAILDHIPCEYSLLKNSLMSLVVANGDFFSLARYSGTNMHKNGLFNNEHQTLFEQ